MTVDIWLVRPRSHGPGLHVILGLCALGVLTWLGADIGHRLLMARPTYTVMSMPGLEFRCRQWDQVRIEHQPDGGEFIRCRFQVGFLRLPLYEALAVERPYRPGLTEKPDRSAGIAEPPEYLAPSDSNDMWLPVLDFDDPFTQFQNEHRVEWAPVPQIPGRCEVRVPAQKLADALRLLFEQCPGHQWMYWPDAVKGAVSHAVSGQLTVDDALDRVLPAGLDHLWSGQIVGIRRPDIAGRRLPAD